MSRCPPAADPASEYHREGTCLGCGFPSQELSRHDLCRACQEEGPPPRHWNTPPAEAPEITVS